MKALRISLFLWMWLILIAQSPAMTFTVTNTSNTGPGSLSQAITDANENAGLDTIAFNLPGPPPFTIPVQTPLPLIVGPVIIDGTTQPGFSGRPIIELDGSQAGASAQGLYLLTGSAGSTIRGLVINRFAAQGITIYTASNTVQSCFIGTDLSGTNALGNGQDGIGISGSGYNLIGGPAGAGNVIAGNGGSGIQIYSPSNTVQGNFIGTDTTGSQPLGNGTDGIQIPLETSSVSDANIIGGTAAGTGNTIAFNGRVGVWVAQGNHIPILGNAIYANGGIGIDLGGGYQYPDGPTPNNSSDTGTGPNGRPNYPVITSVSNAAGVTTIQGTLNSSANTGFRLEFFANPGASDRFAFSEGMVFQTATNVTTDANGNADFTVTVPGLAQNPSATATDSGNNTSEFSLVPLTPPAAPKPQTGDLFIGIGYGKIQWRRADGSPVRLLDTAQSAQYSPLGLAFDSAGNLFAGTRDGQTVVKFDVGGTNLGAFGGTFGGLVSGVECDALDNVLVGLFDGSFFKLDPLGNILEDIALSPSYFVSDLAADQRTLVYSPSPYGATSRGVYRYDIINDAPLPSLATNLANATVSDLRIAPGGQLLIATSKAISELDSHGVITNTIGAGLSAWSIIKLAPDGKSVLAIGGDPYLYQFDLVTGALLAKRYIEYILPQIVYGGNQLIGGTALAVRSEPVAASTGVALAIIGSPDPLALGQTVTYTLTAVNHSPATVNETTVADTLPAGLNFSQASAGQGTVSPNGSSVVFNLGSLAPGARVVMSLTAIAAAAGTLTNTAVMTGSGLDPASTNYLALATTLVAAGAVTPFTVLTTNNSGAGSLRAVLNNVNNSTNTATVTFNIPGPGVHVIQALETLPPITNTVTLDGYSQPGAQPNTLAQADNAVVLVALTGSEINFGFGSSGSLIRGLSLPGLYLGDDAITVQGNFIGVDPTGANGIPGASGIYFNGTFSHQIGGSNPADRNLISANSTGISSYGAPNPFYPPSPSLIQGNFIGTDRTGAAPLGNTNQGIYVGEPLMLIGGANQAEGNVIAFNGSAGIDLGGRGAGLFVEGNSIFSNGGPGITDGDPGPILTGAGPASSTVQGLIEGAPDASFRIEVFGNSSCDPSGYGQGQMFLGAAHFDGDQHGQFRVGLSLPSHHGCEQRRGGRHHRFRYTGVGTSDHSRELLAGLDGAGNDRWLHPAGRAAEYSGHG